MAVQTNRVFNDLRQNLRVNENRTISWWINDKRLHGRAKVLNISSSGMLIETNSNFHPTDQCVFTFDSSLGKDNFIPDTGRLVWHKKKNSPKNEYWCGVQFVDPAADIVSKLEQRVQKGIAQAASKRQWEGILSVLFIIGAIALTGFIMWFSTTIYQNVTESNNTMIAVSDNQFSLTRDLSHQLVLVKEELEKTKKLYEETKAQLDLVSAELQDTKNVLIQTQTLLALANQQISQLKGEVVSIEALGEQKIAQTMAEVTTLQQKNTELVNELTAMQDKLKYYEGNAKTMDEAKSLLSWYKEKMNIVKGKVKQFKLEAFSVKVAAQKERDRIRSSIGNNGYLTKDGRPVIVDMEKFNSNDLGVQDALSPAANPKVQVDVQFVN